MKLLEYKEKRTVSGLWIGDDLSPLAKLCITSFLANGYGFDLYAYENFEVPEGCTLKDASVIIDSSAIWRDCNGSYAPFSDAFRFTFLCREGGCWVDMDIVCLNDRVPTGETVFVEESPGYLSTGFIAGRRDANLWKWLYVQAWDPAAIMPWDNPGVTEAKNGLKMSRPVLANRRIFGSFGFAGPGALSKGVEMLNGCDAEKRKNVLGGIVDFEVRCFKELYAIPYGAFSLLFEGDLDLNSDVFAKSWGVHFWHEMVRRNGGVKVDGNSIFATLCRKYGLPVPSHI